MLTKRQFEILKQMAEAHGRDDFENAEIAAEGLVLYLGIERIGRSTLNAFHDHTLVSEADYSGGRAMYWEINETGLAVVRRPELAEEVWMRLRSGKPFTIKNDRIVDL